MCVYIYTHTQSIYEERNVYMDMGIERKHYTYRDSP